MKNTLTTNKLECFIIHIIFIDLLSVLHIPGVEAVPKVRFDIQTLCLPDTSEHFFKETIPSVQPFYINSHPYYLSSPSAVSAFYLFCFYSPPVIFRRIDSKISVQTTRYTKL